MRVLHPGMLPTDTRTRDYVIYKCTPLFLYYYFLIKVMCSTAFLYNYTALVARL